MMATKLHRLPEDILLRIVRFLDVFDALAAEQTCQTLHLVVGSRRFWHWKLHQLGPNRVPSLPPAVEVIDLTCSELRLAVVKAVRWLRALKKGVSVSQGALVSSVYIQKRLGRTRTAEFTLDGKHLIIYTENRFYVFCTRTGQPVCEWVDDFAGSVVMFTLKTVSKDTVLVLLVSQMNHPETTLLRILRLSFGPDQTTHIEGLKSRRVNREGLICPFWPSSLILDENTAVMVAVAHEARQVDLIVWDWKKDRLVKILLGAIELSSVRVMHGYVFCFVGRKTNNYTGIKSFALEALAHLESTIIDINALPHTVIELKALDHSPEFVGEPNFPYIMNVGLYDLGRIGIPDAAEACILIRFAENGGAKSHFMAYRYRILFRNSGETRGPTFHSLHRSARLSPDINDHVPGIWPKAVDDESGRVIAVVLGFRFDPDTTAASRTSSSYVIGTDENDEVFVAPLSRFPLEGGTNFILQKNGGALVRFIKTNDFYRIDVHFVR